MRKMLLLVLFFFYFKKQQQQQQHKFKYIIININVYCISFFISLHETINTFLSILNV